MGDRRIWNGAKIGNRVSIGSNAAILPVTIRADVEIDINFVTASNIFQSGIYACNHTYFCDFALNKDSFYD